MDDLISRQAAVGEVKKHYRAYDNDLLELITFDIERLPSAQSEITRCKDCKHYEDGWIHCNRVTWWNGADDFCSMAERKADEID